MRFVRYTVTEKYTAAVCRNYSLLGIMLLLLNLALSGVVLLTIVKGTAKTHSEIMVISIAAYTFYKITMAVINMVKVRKMQSPSLITIRNIGVADALVSMLTLQTTMLASACPRSRNKSYHGTGNGFAGRGSR